MEKLIFKHENALIAAIQEHGETIIDRFESFDHEHDCIEPEVMEVCHKSYDGFMSMNNGGYRAKIPCILQYTVGNGVTFKNEAIAKELDSAHNMGLGSALESFLELNASALAAHYTAAELAEDKESASTMFNKGEFINTNVNYHDLYEKT